MSINQSLKQYGVGVGFCVEVGVGFGEVEIKTEPSGMVIVCVLLHITYLTCESIVMIDFAWFKTYWHARKRCIDACAVPNNRLHTKINLTTVGNILKFMCYYCILRIWNDNEARRIWFIKFLFHPVTCIRRKRIPIFEMSFRFNVIKR